MDKCGDLRRWLEASDAHLVADELPLLLVVVLPQQARLVWREVHGVLRDRTGKRVRVHRMWIMSTEPSCSKAMQQLYLLLLRLNAHADQRSRTGPEDICSQRKDPKITIYWQISGRDTSSDFNVWAAKKICLC